MGSSGSVNLTLSTCWPSLLLPSRPPSLLISTPRLMDTVTLLSFTAGTPTTPSTLRSASRLHRQGDPHHPGRQGGRGQRLLLRPCADSVRGDLHHRGERDLHLRVRAGDRHPPLHHHPGDLRGQVRDHEGDCLWSCWLWLWSPGIRPGRTPGLP